MDRLPSESEEEQNRPVAISEFIKHVENLHKDTNYLFANEYEVLRVSVTLDILLYSYFVFSEQFDNVIVTRKDIKKLWTCWACCKLVQIRIISLLSGYHIPVLDSDTTQMTQIFFPNSILFITPRFKYVAA